MSQVEWKEYTLGDFIKIKHGYAFKGDYISTEDNGIVLVTPGNFAFGGGFQERKCKFFTDEYPKEYVFHAGDLIVTMTDLSKDGDTLGYSAKIPETNNRVYLHNQRIGLIQFLRDDIIDHDFLYWFMRTPNYQKGIVATSSGSTVKHTSPGRICESKIFVPPLEEQKRIAGILSSLDDKIELNNAINKNLEQQIDSIIYEMALLNDTCQKVKLGDYLYIKGRIGWKGLKKDEYLETSDYRIVNGESLMESGIDWAKAGYISKERYDESPEIMLEVGDILLSKDGTIGKIGYIDGLELPTSVASGIFVIRNQQPENISTAFIYYLLKSRLFKGFIEQRTEGSVIPHLYQKDFMDFIIPLPISQEMKKINDVIQPMFEKVIANLNENKNLIRQRNALLPKLMSIENFSNE